ncbi:cytochrome P450 [Thamnocephalis sphaerospora]|uniref:Cytochrome P450 n=1 Tax=Thamnocephalis sphaerospora TaxID=78915 RepID=A0A4P9XJV3_9FUNG|nr:cytochrome P450 [Thamnocephalis sphaerospora]|eukprot:RKP05480.1 cytochrome P450 [Thamnocephalis sphaerospora]
MALESLISLETVLLLSATYVLYTFVSNKILSPLRDVPGPWLYSLSSIFYMWRVVRGTHLGWLHDLHEKHGPIVRVTPDTVNVRDIDAAHAVHLTHKFIKGPMHASFDITGKENLFSARDPKISKARRKLALPMFTRIAVEEMDEMIMSSGIRPLLSRLERHAEASDTINIMRLFNYMTFDVISDIAFGRSFNLLEDDNDGDNIVKWLNGLCQLCVCKHAFGPLANKWLMPGLYECKRKSINVALDAVRARRATNNPRPDSLNRYLAAVKDEKADEMTDLDIAADMVVQMVGGTDTTAVCCTWTVYLLSRTPDVHARLLQELCKVVPDINTEITHAMVHDLPYLNAVINESLRIYPVAGADAPRAVPKGGAELCGKYLPEGTVIMGMQYMTNRWSELWDEPEAFKPERWLIEDEARLEAMKHAFHPFSIGVRACVGRELAWMELRVALASVVRRFAIDVVPGDDMTPAFNLIVAPRGHTLTCRLEKRAS